MNNKLLLLVVTVIVSVFWIAAPKQVYANVFASDVKVVNPGGGEFDGDLNDDTPGVGIQFRLNENATSVVITVSNAGGVVATIDAGPHGAGLNEVVWAGVDDSGSPVPVDDYTFSVTASDAVGHSAYNVIYANSGTSIFTRGGTTIRNPAAPNFGHPVGGNGGGAGLKRGPVNFFADGSGFEQTPENLDRFSPWDVRDINPNGGRLYMITSDDDGNLYYSDRLDPLSKLYTFGADLDSSSLAVVTTADDSSKNGMGIDVVGTGADRVIYWGLANTVVRMAIGDSATFDPANFEVVATFEDTIFIRDILIDDSGFMYLSLRRGSETGGTNPGLAVERYDISGTLPVTRTDAQWTVPVGFDNGNGRPVGFGFERGDDLASNADDIIYFSSGSGSADGNWNTIRKIDDLATGGSSVVFTDISGSGTTSDNADMSVDAAGNLIWFENSSEWLIAVSPPDGPNSFTTPANDIISIETASTANAHPGISGVVDIPNDQGYQVLVSWSGSVNDRLGHGGVSKYEVYRLIPPPPAAANAVNGPPGSWELVGTASARQTSNYNLTVATVVNQTADNPGVSTFFVSAVSSEGTRWDSKPASGASEDNLIPTAPDGVTASEVEGANLESYVQLDWSEPVDEDFDYFAVVRGTSGGFDPASAEVVGTTTGTSLVDNNIASGETYFYRVVAYDFNGNQGEFSDEVTLLISSVAGGSSLPEAFALSQNYPNPFNPTTQITFDLPETADVTLKIFNMRGQEIRTLVNESKPAGSYTIQWNGLDNSGLKTASGIYVYMIKAGNFVKSYRMTLLK